MSVVLVTDANQELRDIFRSVLAKRGHRVDSAAEALECLEKMRRLRPDVLLLDHELPWGECERILDWLREESPTAGPAVVLTTGNNQLPPELLAPPVVGCLRKPFTMAELQKSVAAAGEALEDWGDAACERASIN